MNSSGASLVIIAILQAYPGCTAITPASKLAPTGVGSCKCGVPQVTRNRIVGGQPAKKNQYPWLVAIFKTGVPRSFCGGSLISSRTVLTALHCLLTTISKLRVHVGEHDVT